MKLLVACALATAAAACLPPGGVDTLTHVPQPASSRELEALSPTLRERYRAWFPDRELLRIYPAERDWRPRRHPDTGVVLWREAEYVIGYRDGAFCRYTIYRAFQERMGSSWTKVELGYPQGPNGDRELRKTVDCASIPTRG